MDRSWKPSNAWACGNCPEVDDPTTGSVEKRGPAQWKGEQMEFARDRTSSAPKPLRTGLALRRGIALCAFAASLAAAQTIPYSDTFGYRIIGRTESTPDGPVLNWSGTALEIGFQGNQVQIHFGYDRAIFQASLDDVPLPDLMLLRNGYW